MINEKISFDCELVQRPIICGDNYQHRWMGVQMPPLTAENSHFLRSGSQDAALVMDQRVWVVGVPILYIHSPILKYPTSLI